MYEATQMLLMVDCEREMTVKRFCKYGEYGSFVHLLILFTTFRIVMSATFDQKFCSNFFWILLMTR